MASVDIACGMHIRSMTSSPSLISYRGCGKLYGQTNLHLHVFMWIDVVNQLKVVGELSIDFFLSIPPKIVPQRYHKDIGTVELCLLSILISQNICSIVWYRWLNKLQLLYECGKYKYLSWMLFSVIGWGLIFHGHVVLLPGSLLKSNWQQIWKWKEHNSILFYSQTACTIIYSV